MESEAAIQTQPALESTQRISIGDIAHSGSVISVGIALLLSLVLALVIVRRARSTQVWLPLLLTVTIPFVVCLLCAFVVGAEDFYAIAMSRDAHASDSYMALATLLFSLWIGIACSLICAIVAVIPLIRKALRARDDGSADAAGPQQVSAMPTS